MLKQYTAIGLMLCASTVMCTQHAAAETAPASEVKILQDRPVSWMRAPKVKFEPGDLEGRPRSVNVAIDADSSGNITAVKIITSSGLPDLDEMVINAVKKARFRPYIESGISYPFRATQPFEFNADDYSSTRKTPKRKPIKTCWADFEPEGLQLQQSGQHRTFQYKDVPAMKLPMTESEAKQFSIDFSFSVDRKNQISDIRLIQSPSDPIARLLLKKFELAKIEAPRKFYQIFKFQFKERIQLKNIQCN